MVTSPTGAVIRDILHRLEDRFPRRVLVWPVRVQGEGSAEQIAAAIRGFNALEEGELQTIVAGKLDAVDGNEAAAAAFLADGSAGRALALTEHGGFDLYREMVGVMETLPQLDVEKLHGLAGRFGARVAPESFSLFCYLFSGWLHRYARACSTGEAFQPVFEGEAELAARFMAGQLPLEPAVSLWEKLQQQTRSIEALNLDKKQAVLDWFAELADIGRH